MSAAVAWEPHPLTVAQVLAMVQAGILDDKEPVELLDGVLTAVPPQGPEHRWLVGTITRRVADAFRNLDAEVDHEWPLHASAISLPEPDISVTAEPRRRDRHPRGDECLLVVEVAITSLERDLRKASTYARAGVPEYWIVDVPGRRVLGFAGPREDGTWAREWTSAEDAELEVPGGTGPIPVRELLGED